MARQRRAGVSRLSLIAIDPGDVHTGFASVEIHGDISIWRSGVLESPEDYLRPVSMVGSLFDSLRKPILALEDFRIRSVGHQVSNRVLTPRLIGALEYLARSKEIPTHFYQPGNIERDLEGFGLSTILEKWKWPPARGSDWGHARSAWRILGHLVLNELPELEYLFDPKQCSRVHSMKNFKDNWGLIMGVAPTDLWSHTLIVQRKN